ncbi:MAG: RidA family protein [Deltaproteobacteria bacterium]|nr:RidA family protein [Deltaproteobacteria bacterium]MBI3076247.1 RidA family protein [Deltaproteobacteria bacterium]
MEAERRLEALGIVLPRVAAPIANYVQWVQAGQFLYLAGAVPRYNDEFKFLGKVDGELSLEEAYQAARYCTMNHLAMVKQALGDLDRVERVVQLIGYVSSSPGFRQQPKVVDGASDLWVEVYGERGRHVRAALGIAEIARNIPVETIVTLLIRP